MLGIIVLLVAIPVGLLVVADKMPGKYDKFAQCISDSGAKFYGAYWCSHCAAQKALFGKSVKKLPYVECSLPPKERDAAARAASDAVTKGTLKPGQDPREIGIKNDLDVCHDVGVTSYPTWMFTDGSRFTGELTFAQLAEKTGCPNPQN